MNPDPFDWWEYDTASTQVLPLVIGPEIPDIPVSDVERCEMAAYESLARMAAEEESQPVALEEQPASLTGYTRLPAQLIESFLHYLLFTYEGNLQLERDPELAEQVVELVQLRRL
jgi:hypothetical protein